MMRPLSAADTALLHMDDPTHPMMVTAVLWFDEPVDWDVMAPVLVARLLARYPRFAQRIVEPGSGLVPLVAGWQDADVAPGEHVARATLAGPGDRGALTQLVSTLMSTPLDMSRPPWHLTLVDGYREGGAGGCAIVARLHHAIADGIALAQVLLSLTDPAPPGSAPGPDQQDAEPAPPQGRLLGRALGRGWQLGSAALRHPGQVLRAPVDLLSLSVTLGRLLALPSDPDTVFRGPLQTSKQAAWSPPAPLEEVKRLARAMGASVNDVLLAVAAGALRHYALSRGQTPVDIRAFVPVNLRPPGAPGPDLGNQFGLVLLALPVGTADPVARVHQVRASMDGLKGGQQALLTYGLVGLLGTMPEPVAALAVAQLARKGSVVMTNVPGPTSRITLGGAPVAGILFWVPQTGQVALGVCIFSYAGTVTIGVASDAGVIGDPASLSDALGSGLVELRDALSPPGVAAPATGGRIPRLSVAP